MSTVGSRIKNRRVSLGLSVDELAEKLGKNRATVYRYESNDIENLPLEVIPPLAAALSVTPAYLMGWEGDSFEISEAFKTNANSCLSGYDYFDLEEARRYGSEVDAIEQVINTEGPILLDKAYEVASFLGVSMDDLTGLADYLKEGQPEDIRLAEEFANLFAILNLENRKTVLAGMRVLAAAQQSADDPLKKV